MYDWEAHSNCESENIIYRLFWMFLKGKTKEEAIEEVLKDDKNDSPDNKEKNDND